MATRTTRETIWECLCDINSQEQIATREVLAEMTGLSMQIVDEHVKNLINDGRVRRLRAGVFVPVETLPPARPVSVTLIASGMAKVEIGDSLLDLTPREARMLGTALAGFAVQFAQIQTGHEFGHLANELELRQRVAREMVVDLQRRVAAMENPCIQAAAAKSRRRTKTHALQ